MHESLIVFEYEILSRVGTLKILSIVEYEILSKVGTLKILSIVENDWILSRVDTLKSIS